MIRRVIAVALVAAGIGLAESGGRRAAAQDGYTSPFSIVLDPAITAWTSDFPARQAVIDANTKPSMAVWYSSTTSYAGYPYGPLNPQLYSSGSLASPAGALALEFDRGPPVLDVTLNAIPGGVDPTTWQRQRVLAAANVLLQAGTHYQHLHLPSFDPAQVTSGTGFPWMPVSTNATLQSSVQLANHVSGTTPNPYAAAYGRPAPGIDCTDFTAYVYSLALGVQMHSGTPDQVEFIGGSLTAGGTATATVLDTTGTPISPQFFYGPNFGESQSNAPGTLDSLVSQFQPGDLLYIGNPHAGILHVVMWLGQTGTDTTGNTFPLVISSHDNTPAIFDTLALDENGFPSDGNVAGHLPPPGVHILPFAASNWFYQDFQLAMRVIPVPEPGGIVLAALGLVVAGAWRHRGRACLASSPQETWQGHTPTHGKPAWAGKECAGAIADAEAADAAWPVAHGAFALTTHGPEAERLGGSPSRRVGRTACCLQIVDAAVPRFSVMSHALLESENPDLQSSG